MKTLIEKIDKAVREKVIKEWEDSHYGDIPTVVFDREVEFVLNDIVEKLVG